MNRSFYIATFGCKVNQYDSQVMREALLAAGYEEKARGQRPDIAIVNTCTVTRTADAKARRLIRRINRETPNCRIVVIGCTVNRDPDELASLPGVWRVLRNEDKANIASLIGSDTAEEPAPPSGQSDTPLWATGISDFAGHTRAFVKIQEGCNARCAYCIVPLVRGKSRSRPVSQVLDEVRRLAPRFREIVLTGIHIGLYRDASAAGLAALVRRVLDVPSLGRVRLSSLEVTEVSPELIQLAAASPRFCPHFHIPLQSGSDRVLEKMNRPYTAGEFIRAIARVRNVLDRPAVTTDVIVGFPGETDKEFAETVAVCKAVGVSRIHIFPYSARPGTAAERLEPKCPESVITDRKKHLGKLASELALEYKQQFIGATVVVLAETRRHRSGRLCGYTARYLRVLFDGSDKLRNQMVPVVVTGAAPGVLLGRLSPENA